jgi:hypothetical protein
MLRPIVPDSLLRGHSRRAQRKSKTGSHRRLSIGPGGGVVEEVMHTDYLREVFTMFSNADFFPTRIDVHHTFVVPVIWTGSSS